MGTSYSITKESFDYVRGLLNRLARPIALAHRQGGAERASIKNLNRFISDQIVQALGEVVLPRKIEADLLLLRSLFQGDKNPIPKDDITRLNHAQQVLDRISFLVGSLSKENAPSVTGSPGTEQTKRLDTMQTPSGVSDKPNVWISHYMKCPFVTPKVWDPNALFYLKNWGYGPSWMPCGFCRGGMKIDPSFPRWQPSWLKS